MENEETILLERKKLALEIADMERAWWKRPAYLLAALPTLLAIAALSVGFLNGFFSAQLTKLDNQKHDLEAQVREFEVKRDALHVENNTLSGENEKIKLELEGRTQEARNRAMMSEKAMMEKVRCLEELQKLKSRQK